MPSAMTYLESLLNQRTDKYLKTRTKTKEPKVS
jgi:hypothetical protein